MTQQNPEDIQIEVLAEEEDDEASGSISYQTNTFPADFTLEVLHQKWKNNDFQIPPFQRGYVWKLPQASKLIESFLLGLPVPPIFLFASKEDARQLVVDGQQRMKTVFYFFDETFGGPTQDKKTVFRLKGLSESSPFFERTFGDLSEKDQRRLKNCVLRSFIIQQLDPDDDTSVYHVFERLNTGGTALSNQEVRNCVYRGPFNDRLRELNSHPSWRTLLGAPKPDSRQKDIELLLRFLSLLDWNEYQKPLKEFMSRAMKKLNKRPQGDLNALAALFLATCERAQAALGQRPFHITSGLNTAVYDSMMVGIAKSPTVSSEQIQAMHKSLLADADYRKHVRDATTDVEVVKKRMEAVLKALK
jgi:Protein of unknown function DUF262